MMRPFRDNDNDNDTEDQTAAMAMDSVSGQWSWTSRRRRCVREGAATCSLTAVAVLWRWNCLWCMKCVLELHGLVRTCSTVHLLWAMSHHLSTGQGSLGLWEQNPANKEGRGAQRDMNTSGFAPLPAMPFHTSSCEKKSRAVR